MFTGLIADLGEITDVAHSPDGVVLTVSSALTGDLSEGDSIAVNGVCLTATAVAEHRFSAEVIVATGANEPARLRSALDQLGAEGISSILLEGGPHLAGVFLDAGEIDEVRLFLAPVILGGRTARDPLEGEGVEQISEAVRALTLDCERIDDDLLVSARIKDW